MGTVLEHTLIAARTGASVAAASSFAVDYLGFLDPVIGEFQGGDSRSGEVSSRPTSDGPVTTVFVRMVTSDDSWWVLGAATANLQLVLQTLTRSPQLEVQRA